MYNSPFNSLYNSQMNIDKINEQISNLEKIRGQLQQPIQPTNLTQNFQLAPTNRDVIRYADSIEEVKKDVVIGDTPYFSKDMSIVWIKSLKGDIKTYELVEILPKDEKDLQIELLQTQIDDLRKELRKNEQSTRDVISTKVEKNTPRNDDTNGTTDEKSKYTGVQRVSTSKKRQ